MDLHPHIRGGYRARRAGKAIDANPWQPESVAGTAWAWGWHMGDLPWWARWPMAAALRPWVR